MVTRKPRRPVQTVEELREEQVGTIRATSMTEIVALARVPPANIVDTFASGGLPAGLREGQITAAVLGLEDALVAQRADPALQLGASSAPARGSPTPSPPGRRVAGRSRRLHLEPAPHAVLEPAGRQIFRRPGPGDLAERAEGMKKSGLSRIRWVERTGWLTPQGRTAAVLHASLT